MADGEKLIPINIEDEMKSAYIDYSMSVIVSRALPDVRDGLKPVHRRVLYGMYELGVLSNRGYKKSDNIDEVIKIIRASSNGEEARENLIKRFELSEIQARAIVEMRLRQLTGLEQDKLRTEYNDLLVTIADLKDILAKKESRMEIIKEELAEIRENCR